MNKLENKNIETVLLFQLELSMKLLLIQRLFYTLFAQTELSIEVDSLLEKVKNIGKSEKINI